MFSLFVLYSFWIHMVRIYPVEVEAVDGYPVHNLETRLNYTTIQEAINDNETLDGHTIFVDSGIYYEYVVINKSLSLVGEGREETIIEGNGSRRGIVIQRSGVSVSGFTVRNYIDGIFVGAKSHTLREVVIDGNIISHCQIGIDIGSDSFSMIDGDRHMVKNNIVENNTYGIRLQGCFNVTICRNEVENNTENGIELTAAPHQPIEVRGSYYNLVVGNTIADNGLGIFLAGRDNVFYHNNFIDNQNQVAIHQDIIMDNDWSLDHPECGNYWSNYTGADGDHDGIGDTSHVLDANNTDYYPLMGMFSDFEATFECNIQTVCSSTISDFQFNETAISFNVSGANNTAGFCRICIPTALMNDTFRVFVNGTEIQPSPEPMLWSNSTHNYLYFTYSHSTLEVVIIPEFPSFLILPLSLIATLTAIICYRRKFT